MWRNLSVPFGEIRSQFTGSRVSRSQLTPAPWQAHLDRIKQAILEFRQLVNQYSRPIDRFSPVQVVSDEVLRQKLQAILQLIKQLSAYRDVCIKTIRVQVSQDLQREMVAYNRVRVSRHQQEIDMGQLFAETFRSADLLMEPVRPDHWDIEAAQSLEQRPLLDQDTYEVHHQLIAERARAIGQIGESTAQIAEMMRDLSVLVLDQSDILHRCETNIEASLEQVDEGVDKLKDSRKIAEDIGKKNWVICALIFSLVLCFLIVLVVILKVS